MRRYFKAFGIAGLVMAISSTALAQTEALPVVADSYTKANSPTRNYAGNSTMKVSSWNTKIGFVRFPQPTSTGTVVSASLSLGIQDVNNPGFIDIHLVLGDWDESGLTAQNAPPIDPQPIATVSVAGSDEGGTVSVDVATAVSQWLSSPNINFGFALVPSPVESMSAALWSSEGAVSPELVVVLSGGGSTNSPPVARDDNFSVAHNVTATQLDVLNNDSDADLPGDELRISAVGATSNGGQVINQSSSLTYTPAAGFAGTETFRYTISDLQGASSTALVSVNVAAAPPTGGDGEPATAAIVGDSFTNDGSPTRNSGGSSVLKIVTNNSKTGYVRYDAATISGPVASAELRIFVSRVSNSGYVDVHMVQSPWTESGITAANAPTIDPVPIAAFRVLGSDLGGFVTADVTLAAQAWAASPGTNYGLALLPSPRESISIDLHSRESSNPGSLLINGGSSDGNAPPTARDDDYSVSSGSGSRTFDVLDNDSDPDEPGDTIRVFSVTPASNGGTVVNNITGIRYTPAPGFVGTETFDYTIADEAGLTSTATVTVNVSGGGSSQTWRIMPVGDSITEASGSRNSYRRPLWHSLNDAGYDINFVGSQSGNRDGQVPNPDFDTDHEGHWGWRADRFLNNNNIRNWATTHRPDVVLIHLGTNDIFNGQSVSGTINEISQIIDEMRSVNPDIIVLVAQIIPTSDPGRPSLDPFNDAIPGLVASKNTSRSPVRLVDQNSGFNASVDTYDGIHPDLSGETKMAAKWFEALVPLLSN